MPKPEPSPREIEKRRSMERSQARETKYAATHGKRPDPRQQPMGHMILAAGPL
jgi:hypothetical protein